MHGEVVCMTDHPIFNTIEDPRIMQIKIAFTLANPTRRFQGAQLKAQSSIGRFSSILG